MATDVNKESRKRKSASDLMLEVDETDLSPSNTPEPTEADTLCPINQTEATQTVTDVSKVSEDIILKSDDITLKQEINSTCNEPNVKLECTMESNELNMETKTTNLNISLKPVETSAACIETSTGVVTKEETVLVPGISKTDVDLRCMDMEVDNSPTPPPSIDKPLISVIFRDKDIAYDIRSKIMHCIQNIMDFELKLKLTTTFPSDLTLDFWEDKNSVNYDTPENIQATSYKSEPENLDLFVVDTTPSKNSEFHPRYSRANLCKPIGEPEPVTNGNAVNACRSFPICFNCDGGHAMKDCKEIRNARRIAMARNKFKSQQQKNVRYHVDEEIKYKHLVPGKISDELRRALDVRKHELPHYVYRMRTLGYPPGWLQEAMISNCKLELFDFHGCVVEDGGGDAKKIDATKVVEYPGFNAPLEKGFKDEFKYYNCPPFNDKHSKNCMVEYIEQLGGLITVKKQTVTANPTPTPKQVESDSNSQGSVCAQKVRRSESPTLTDLELRKKQLLAELEDGSLNSPQPTNDATDKQINPLSKDIIESPVVKSSSFGTPLIKSASPYIQLPERDKFSKDISQVINFENLPDSTGKYEQMSVVINKVRETVKSSKS